MQSKLVFIAQPCFYGEEFVSGAFAFTGDTENDVCDIFYEIEYIEDGTFRCVKRPDLTVTSMFSFPELDLPKRKRKRSNL